MTGVDPTDPWDNANLRLRNLDEVAALLRRSPEWLYRNHARLTRDTGFPAPLPGFGQNLWDPQALRRWLDNLLPDHLQPAPPVTTGPAGPALGNVIDLEDLTARAERLAGGRP